VVGWEALKGEGIPPVEPSGTWSALWEAEIGAALAHLLAASEGTPVALPAGLVTNTFGHAHDALLPLRPRARTAALVGPGLPADDPAPDIALVPRHPQTGEVWQPGGITDIVPLAADVWMRMAFHQEPVPIPATDGCAGSTTR